MENERKLLGKKDDDCNDDNWMEKVEDRKKLKRKRENNDNENIVPNIFSLTSFFPQNLSDGTNENDRIEQSDSIEILFVKELSY